MFIGGLLLGFCLGFVIGIKIKKNLNQDWLRFMFGCIIVLLWTVSVVISLFNPDYQTPTALHGVLGLVAGWLFQGPILDTIKGKMK